MCGLLLLMDGGAGNSSGQGATGTAEPASLPAAHNTQPCDGRLQFGRIEFRLRSAVDVLPGADREYNNVTVPRCVNNAMRVS